MGGKSTDPPEPWLPIAQDAVAAMRSGITPTDVGAALFRSAARPTWAQVTAFVKACIEHLAPELEYVPDGFEQAEPIRLGQALGRAVMNTLAGLR
jgi:hypothetical protein